LAVGHPLIANDYRLTTNDELNQTMIPLDDYV